MKSSNIFVTGCDEKNKWMLPWIIENFEKHHGDDNDLYIVDFDEGYPELDGWFKKPQIMLEASTWAENVCWIDTDCEIRGNLNGIFDYVQEGKIAIAVDQPWSTRRPERGRWFNSGVVAFTGRPSVLREWARIIWEKQHNEVGDQEVLNWMLGGDPLREITHINELPRIYNTLRLDIEDNTAPPNPKIIHWTGPKGKDKIRKMMK